MGKWDAFRHRRNGQADTTETENPPLSNGAPAEDNVIAMFSKAFNTRFEALDAAHFYAQVNVSDGQTEQMYLVVLDTENKAAEYPVKIFPVSPTAKELFGYEEEADSWRCGIFGIANDIEHKGEILLNTPHLKRLFKAYRENGCFSTGEIAEIVQEVADWTVRTSILRQAVSARTQKKADAKKKPFAYTAEECEKCKRVVLSDRAYVSMLAEALSRDPLETGGVLLGHFDADGTWYVVEATDPGLDTFHSTVHNEMDDKYYNHLYPVLSRLYKNELRLVGLWHRHPGSFDRFSTDDNNTNTAFAKAIGNGTLSFLMNFDPKERLTCYYLDAAGSGEYHKLPVYIGNQYFKQTDFLALNTPACLWESKERLHEEITGTEGNV